MIPASTKVIVPFNMPYITGKEVEYINQAIESRKVSGDGYFTNKCQDYFEQRYHFNKVLLTTSCTHALELAALLLDIKQGDEVIVPSYTFVSTANPFLLRGAKIVFADSYAWHPNMNADKLEALITSKTKAIIPVHYAGMACDMDKIMELATKYNLYVVEDAAQAIESYHKNKNGKVVPLGSIGHLAAFSFHDTKNIIAGEGGMLVINEKKFKHRAEIIREMGTNRSAFLRGEVEAYTWVDIGSSFIPADSVAAFLWAQLECLEEIQSKRKQVWMTYQNTLEPLVENKHITLPKLPPYATNNWHMYYLVLNNPESRLGFIAHLKSKGIAATFHYQSLNNSLFYKSINTSNSEVLTHADHYADCLVRLPLYAGLTTQEAEWIGRTICTYFSEC